MYCNSNSSGAKLGSSQIGGVFRAPTIHAVFVTYTNTCLSNSGKSPKTKNLQNLR